MQFGAGPGGGAVTPACETEVKSHRAVSGGIIALPMSEEVALEPALVAQVQELDARLLTADHFSLLGVPAGAEPSVVKAAFFALSKKLHPDRYFRKELGELRPKLERVFKALSLAHQTLTRPERREAYLAAHPHLKPAPPAPKRVPMQRLTWKKVDLQLPPAASNKSGK